jgi:hypothetical protein
MLDDMEPGPLNFEPAGGAAFISPVTGRIGNWFMSAAGVVPTSWGDAYGDDIVPPRGDSKRARHARGAQLADIYDVYVQLDHPSGRPVDLSAYAGVVFWARLPFTGKNMRQNDLIVGLRDRQARATYFDDARIDDADPGNWFAQRVRVGLEWQRFVLLFDDFRQGIRSPASAARRTLDTSEMISIDFIVYPDGRDYDLWIDDVALLCRGTCPP